MKPLIVIAVLAALLGLILVSQATAGVAIIAFACLLAIFARIAQAESHHREAHPGPLIIPAIERHRQERLAMPK